MGVTWESHGTYYGLSTNALYGAIDILPGVRLSSWGRGQRGDGSCRNGGCLLPPGRGMTDGRKARLHSLAP